MGEVASTKTNPRLGYGYGGYGYGGYGHPGYYGYGHPGYHPYAYPYGVGAHASMYREVGKDKDGKGDGGGKGDDKVVYAPPVHPAAVHPLVHPAAVHPAHPAAAA